MGCLQSRCGWSVRRSFTKVPSIRAAPTSAMDEALDASIDISAMDDPNMSLDETLMKIYEIESNL